MLTVKILGTGCANCKRLEQEARKAVSSLALDADVIKVTDYADILEYNILKTPGLVINEKVVSSGKIPSQAEIISYLTTALEAN